MFLYTLFGSTKHFESDSQLRSGAVVTVFGSTELDLTEVELACDQVILNVINALGETALKVPSSWAIESALVTVFGESRGVGHVPKEATRRLRIQGLCFFGEVRIERCHPGASDKVEAPSTVAEQP